MREEPNTPKRDISASGSSRGSWRARDVASVDKQSVLSQLKTFAQDAISSSASSNSKEGEDDTAGALKGALFLLVVIAIYVLYMFATGQVADILDALQHVSVGWVIAAIVVWLIYFLFGVGAYAVAVWFDRDSPVGLRDLLSVGAAGIFFGNLTPGAAGAAPAEILRLTRSGLGADEAFSTQFTKFLVLQAAQVSFMGVALAIGLPVYYGSHGPIIFLDVLCFFANLMQFLGPLIMCLFPTFVSRIGNSLIKFLSMRGWLKNYARWYDLVNRQVQEFSEAYRRMINHPQGLLAIYLLLVGQQIVLCMIPWFVLRAFGRPSNLLACTLAGAMVQMFSSAIPLPGGTGGAEAGFALFFGDMFGPVVNAGFLVWRIVCYFAPTMLLPTMLGLRSNNDESLYQRWNTYTRGGKRAESTRKPTPRR